eukprot:6910918-Pyramimonas_sp.AAC.1
MGETPDFVAAQEPRLPPGDPVSSASSWAGFRGPNFQHAPAVLTGDHRLANSAGVAVAVRRYIANRHLKFEQLGVGPVGKGRIASTHAQAVVLGGIHWVSVYGYTGIGCIWLEHSAPGGPWEVAGEP